MRSRIVTFLYLAILIAYGIAVAQNLPPDLQRQYERYLSEAKTQAGASDAKFEYETPTIFEETDTTLFEQKETEQKEIVEQTDEGIVFNEYIVVEGDTVQVLTKATPRELRFFGADFFETSDAIPITEAPVSGNYVLAAGDNLLVSVWGNFDYQYNLTVDREGKVFIPKAGTVVVAGYSLDRATESITAVLSNVYSDFHVDVTIAKMRGITVFVVGEAQNPGVFALSGFAYVIDAMVAAGGPNIYGSYRNVMVYRNGRLASKLDLYDFILNGKTDANIQLANGDVITIPRLGPTVKVRGRIRRPAIYEIEDSTTLRGVIELAGGILPDAHNRSIMVDRIIAGQHQVASFDLSDSIGASIFASDGDDFSVFPIDEYRSDLVFLHGHVVQAGPYGLTDSMRISDLLIGGDQLLPDAYTKRADLIRVLPNRRKEIIPLAISEILANPGSPGDYLLRSEDMVFVYSIWDVEDKNEVSIFGAVRRPGNYELYQNMSVSDLVFESGGILESASLERAELARITPGEPSQIIFIGLGEVLENPRSANDIELLPYDALFIREITGWKLQDVITITGEVKYPGKYALQSKNERLSEVIARTGSFTPDAFLKGVIFLRPKLAEDIENKNLLNIVQQTQEVILDSTGGIIRPPLLFKYADEQLARIIIDMEKVVKGIPEDDIVLEAGDSIHIPKIPTGVTVVGMVASSGTIHWIAGKRVKYYIERAGGYTRNADKDGIRLVRANGKVEKLSDNSRKVEPGDIIIVPQRIKKQTDIMSFLNQTVAILSGVATTIYILMKL